MAFSFHQLVRLRRSEEQVVVSTTSPIRGFALLDDRLWYGVQELAPVYANTFNDTYGFQNTYWLRER